ncbi:MAG: hypothetical protein H0T42_02190, partial [Deltaproteobacteria bacterium]|nr:hypothetical protein [Deltaproteobacteria bacterium]
MRPSPFTAVLCMLALALLGACDRDTRIKVTIAGGETSGIDGFQLKVEDRFGVAEPLSELELRVPDEMAGTDAKVELWGLRAGDQVAYGAAVVTPSLHGTVDVTLTLAAITCGTWCQPGSTTCGAGGAGDGTTTCAQAANGCVAWSAPTACPTATPFCSNGSCGATCSDECTAGAMECSGSVATRRCGQFDSDECLDWSPASGCGTGQTCTAGVCSSGQTCNTGDDCEDGNACTDGDTCAGGVCAGDPRVCTEKPPECTSSTTLRMYGLAGTCSASTGDCAYSYIDATCPRGCSNGACNPQVAAGATNSCGIRSTGTLACWGDMSNSSLPTATFSAISVRLYHGCGTTTAGATVCWRRQPFDNFYGEVDVPSGTFTSVSTGEVFTCAIRTAGTIACWGDMTSGKTLAPAGTFTQVSAGVDHSCAVRT